MSRNFGIMSGARDPGGDGISRSTTRDAIMARDSISNVHDLAGAAPRVLTARWLGTRQENQALIRLDKIPNLPDLRGGETVSSFLTSNDRDFAAKCFFYGVLTVVGLFLFASWFVISQFLA